MRYIFGIIRNIVVVCDVNNRIYWGKNREKAISHDIRTPEKKV